MHFESHMFINKAHKSLGKWAVPTIFPGMDGSSTSSPALNISHGQSSASKGKSRGFVVLLLF
ncbi:unnamed protein product [Callosobruchus maculatus]|uniref:Uncharacterized protein n=1 Tax=Callosobruchus maculatus TaxID=64391 RepID=A0A653DQ38_CALMS|nr:unnamed protein product [Callosobruchus maculatus]VEN52597.1 unnamed protein product [Callosobruchus maculatus]VEN62344.1 unnamed protein product [Callosobruchus maculatus]